MLKTRVALGALLIVVLVALLMLDEVLIGPVFGIGHPVLFEVMALFVIFEGLREFYKLMKNAGANPMSFWGIAAAVILYLIYIFRAHAGHEKLDFLDVFLYTTVVLLALVLLRKSIEGGINDVAITVFGIVYVCLLFLFVAKIRFLDGGLWKLLLYLGAAKFYDIGAYIAGTAIGSRKITPTLSPRKTLEGLIGGLVLSVAVTILLNYIFGIVDSLIFDSLWVTVVFALAMGCAAQIGDLVESLFKRNAEKKDSGRLLPGYGGLLDIIDSLLLSAPVAYLFLR